MEYFIYDVLGGTEPKWRHFALFLLLPASYCVFWLNFRRLLGRFQGGLLMAERPIRFATLGVGRAGPGRRRARARTGAVTGARPSPARFVLPVQRWRLDTSNIGGHAMTLRSHVRSEFELLV